MQHHVDFSKGAMVADLPSRFTDLTAQVAGELLRLQYVPLDQAVLWDDNPKRHELEQIKQSIRVHGFRDPMAYDTELGAFVEGHGRTHALREMRDSGEDAPRGIGLHPVHGWCIPVLFGVDAASIAAAKAYAISHNQLCIVGGFNFHLLAEAMQQVVSADDEAMLLATGFDQERLSFLLAQPDNESADAPRRSLAERFVVPPFSVLDARQAYWQERKRAWTALGIQGGLGRKKQITFPRSSQGPAVYHLRNQMREITSCDPTWTDINEEAKRRGYYLISGTSLFDPVLCELAYRWFCPPGGMVLDPFAGGSVRGIVAAYLGRSYIGIDLRAEQVEANVQQAQALHLSPTWIVGDSRNLDSLIGDQQFDFAFTCPPYFNLERYSDAPEDLSNSHDYESFLEAYRQIVAALVAHLRADRFACVVAADIRDGQGMYRGFVSDTIAAFQDAGARLYNEAILVMPYGSLPIRTANQFEAARKLGKAHQNVLVFVKGDPRRATEACGVVEVALPEGMESPDQNNSGPQVDTLVDELSS